MPVNIIHTSLKRYELGSSTLPNLVQAEGYKGFHTRNEVLEQALHLKLMFRIKDTFLKSREERSAVHWMLK